MKWKLKSAVECVRLALAAGDDQCEPRGEEGVGLRDSAGDAPTSSGQTEEVERKRSGQWRKRGRRVMSRCGWSRREERFLDAAAATWMPSGQRRASCSGWQAAGVNTFPASPSVNACQAVAGSRVGNKVEPGP